MTAIRSDPRIEALARILSEHQPRFSDPVPGEAPIPRASVALVVRPAPDDLDLLLIKRATRPGDPWSGHMAFPGGRRSPDDRSAQETAERETFEEVGIDLAGMGTLLGRLDEVWPREGAPARIVVSPFVFAAPSGTGTCINHEVDAALWIPFRALVAPGAATEYLHALASGEEYRFPAIAYESHVIWGLTHRIMSRFLEVARAALSGAP